MMASQRVWDPIPTDNLQFKFPAISKKNLAESVPYFYNDLKQYGDPAVLGRIVSGIIKCVLMGEDKFQQAFGGWDPESNQFGINPLRPVHVDKVNNRWRWVSGTTSTINWSAEDTFIPTFNLATNEMILIFGYYNLEPVPDTLELFIQPGSDKMPIITIEPMRLKQETYFIFPKPIIVEPSSQLAIGASCKSGTTAVAEEAGLLGYMFAPKSKLLTKKRVVS